jgi:hypothetical protein
VALCMVAGLMSCIEDQKQQVARCELDAKRTYPEKTFSGPSPSYDMAHFIQLCMRGAGYDFRCDYFSLSGSYACYGSKPIDTDLSGATTYLAEQHIRAQPTNLSTVAATQQQSDLKSRVSVHKNIAELSHSRS